MSPEPRHQRADARRNVEALLQAAKQAFDETGVDVPVKRIAGLAGVGVGTLYRHFPRRYDLVVAVLRHQIDALGAIAPELLETTSPDDALTIWLERYAGLLATKRGLAKALHSGDPAFEGLPEYFWQRLTPALDSLLAAAAAQGRVRTDVGSRQLLSAIAHLSQPMAGESAADGGRMVAVLIDGLSVA